MAREWKLKIVYFLIQIAGLGWTTSKQIQRGLETYRPGLRMSTVQIGHMARILVDRRLIERERIDPRFQWYRYRALAHNA